MAFFDDLGKKLSQAGQTTLQKTRDIADVAKINMQISDEERKINDTYLKIGKLYVELHAADSEETFKEMVQAVADSQNTIKEYKEQIRDIKGVVNCPKCGAEVEREAAFCAACGEKMPEVSVVEQEAAPAAEQEAAQPAEQEAAPVAEQEVAQPETQEASEKKCPNCGKILESNVNFCQECGTKVC